MRILSSLFCATPRDFHSYRTVSNKAEAEAIKDQLTGEDKDAKDFLTTLEGGDPNEQTFLEDLADNDE